MTRISLHKLYILSFGCGTGGYILHRLEGKLALHILKREQVLFVRLGDDLIKPRSGLRAKDVTRLDKLGGSTFTRHEGGGTI